MKNKELYILLLGLLCILPANSQNDSINRLEEVRLSDVKLFMNSEAQQVLVLKDSTLKANDPLLTSLLKFNSPIYFKENGYGMVSSPSFRGTTASQTAVIWNGININSRFNGQTDFNTINTSGFDNIAIRAGGGSVLYGSGAIGGSIHLNNRFQFNGGFQNTVGLQAGSFNTFSGNYSGSYSAEKTSLYWSAAGVSSDNNYKYPGTKKHNENGDFSNFAMDAGLAHWLNKSSVLKFYTSTFSGQRAFSGTLTAPSNSKYEDLNSRNLLEWKSFLNDFTSSLKLAYLTENFRYFENRNNQEHSFGKAQDFIANYDLNYRFHSAMKLDAVVDFRNTDGTGSSMGEHSRQTGSFSLLFDHELGRFFYEISARQEITNSYNSPFLFSLGAKYAVSENYSLKANFSRNFRIPTYNDLFWYAGKNMDLSPETSWQGEIGQELRVEDLKLSATAYYIGIKDLLRWIPDSGGAWRPENTKNVQNFGLEVLLSWKKSFGEHQLQLNSTYAFTKTENENLQKELIYTPKHKATGSLGYAYEDLSVFWQFLYTGAVFTSSDNQYSLPGYALSNFGVNYSFGKENRLKLGAEIRNIFDTSYESLPSRPMPGRSLNTSLTFNF